MQLFLCELMHVLFIEDERVVVMFILLLTLVFISPDDQADLVKARRAFIGSWELIQIIKDGEVQQEPVGSKTIFVFSSDGTYVGKAGDSVIGKGTFKPISNTKPAAIDWTAASRQEYDGKFTRDYSSVGIYRMQGDTLTIVLKYEGKPEDRPNDFDCKAGSQLYLMKLKRQKLPQK